MATGCQERGIELKDREKIKQMIQRIELEKQRVRECEREIFERKEIIEQCEIYLKKNKVMG